MDVLQKEIDEVYATQLIADEILDNALYSFIDGD